MEVEKDGASVKASMHRAFESGHCLAQNIRSNKHHHHASLGGMALGTV